MVLLNKYYFTVGYTVRLPTQLCHLVSDLVAKLHGASYNNNFQQPCIAKMQCCWLVPFTKHFI